MADGDLAALLVRLEEGDEASREAAAMALGDIGPAAAQQLGAMLSAPDATIRWWAARALAEVGDEAAVRQLEHALEDPDAEVRACACLALGRIGEVSAAAALASHLADESAFVADIAADALSMLGEGAVPALARMLQNRRPATRLLAVRALCRTRSQRAAEYLLGVLEDSSYLVSQSALEALEQLGVGMVYFSP